MKCWPIAVPGLSGQSLVGSLASGLGLWNPAPDDGWTQLFPGKDLSYLDHFSKTFLVLLELKGWSGYRYCYDTRFSGYGATEVFALLLLMVVLVRKKAFFYWKAEAGFILFTVFAFYILSPFKYYPRYTVLLWPFFFFLNIAFLKVLYSLSFDWFNRGVGRTGGALKGLCDDSVVVVAENSDRIQEIHIKIIHILIEAIERNMFPEHYL